MLDREHLPGAPEAGLHLVDDEHDPVLVADAADAREELLRSDDEAALALHRLDHERGDALRRDGGHERALERVERIPSRRPAIVLCERHAIDLGRERAEARLVRVRLRRQGHGQQRPAVEAALECDHRRPLGVRARELDRVLDRLGAGVEERGLRRARERGHCHEPLRQRDVELVRNDREVGVREAVELLVGRSDHARMRVTDVQAPDAAGEVQERVPVDVGDRRALAVIDDDRQEDRERVGDHARLPVEDLLRARPRDRGLELDRLRRRHAAHDNGASGPSV